MPFFILFLSIKYERCEKCNGGVCAYMMRNSMSERWHEIKRECEKQTVKVVEILLPNIKTLINTNFKDSTILITSNNKPVCFYKNTELSDKQI